MAIRGRRPQSGPRGVTYLHDKCRDNALRKGWLAGDVHVLEMHVGRGKSRPCEAILLGAGQQCPGCAECRPVEAIGWVPLRREDGRPVCVLVRKATIDFVAQIERGSAVYWGRAEGRFEGVGITPRVEKVRWEMYFSGQPTDDMSYWIPQYLATPHLAAAMRELWRSGECQPVVTQPLPAPVAPIPSEPKGAVSPVKVLEAEIATPALDATLVRLRRKQAALKIREGEQNGVH